MQLEIDNNNTHTATPTHCNSHTQQLSFLEQWLHLLDQKTVVTTSTTTSTTTIQHQHQQHCPLRHNTQILTKVEIPTNKSNVQLTRIGSY